MLIMENVQKQISERPGKTWIVTDTHFHHDRIIEFANRPVDFMTRIIKNWNNTVLPQDTVINLGDVCWGNKEQLMPVINQLVGTKILVRGNHDKGHSNNWFKDVGFAFVCQKLMISNIVLTHMPTRLNEDEVKQGVSNIHGHFHNISFRNWEPYLKDRLSEHHYLLSLEYVKYKPVLLDTAVQKGDVIQSLSLKNKGLWELC